MRRIQFLTVENPIRRGELDDKGITCKRMCLIYNNHLDLTVLQAAPLGALIGVVCGLLQTVLLLRSASDKDVYRFAHC